MRPPGSSPLTRGKRADHTMPTRLAGLIPAHAGKTVLCRLVWPCWWAHPRSRGENRITPLASRKYHGSSPLTRGKLHVFPEHLRTGRLIPAHAGKTIARAKCLSDPRAHPRSRGENRDGVIDRLSIGGSSPLTRGKRIHRSRQRHLPGLIPAHAGKTEAVTAVSVFEWAHPRSRGENFRLRMRAPVQGGSSPLTRGKRRVRAGFSVVVGLIPAHAGKTRVRPAPRLPVGAHPRSRGENLKASYGSSIRPGSSPLTRGKHALSSPPHHHIRLIPAHAGKTYHRTGATRREPAHPRSRGENQTVYKQLSQWSGSSPLTRGKLGGDELVGVLPRLIPAHAGKTRASRSFARPLGAHPRSRGENRSRTRAAGRRAGSSPLTRGKPGPSS